MSTILFGKAFENIIFKVIQVIVKQHQHFTNLKFKRDIFKSSNKSMICGLFYKVFFFFHIYKNV